MISSELDAIKRIVEAFERSDWKQIDVRSAGVRVHLSTTVPGDKDLTTHLAGDDTALGTAVADHSGSQTPASVPARSAAGSAPASEVPSDAQIIRSPSPGIFWRAPEPGAPQFTSIGATIDPGSTLAIIEVMKLMNHIKAGVAGQVVAIFVEDGVPVAKDEPLFAVLVNEAETP